MNKMKSVYLFFILLTGCAPKEHKVLSIDEKLQPYFDTFIREANYRNKFWFVDDLIIQFEEELPKKNNLEILGNCDTNSGGTPVVTINKKTFKRLSQNEKEMLIFHELGHCLLYKGHNDDLDDDGVPVSIMNKYAFSGNVYAKNREGYINELFR